MTTPYHNYIIRMGEAVIRIQERSFLEAYQEFLRLFGGRYTVQSHQITREGAPENEYYKVF